MFRGDSLLLALEGERDQEKDVAFGTGSYLMV